MIEIKEKKDCCGCHGCTNICPKSCISMDIDEEGFWYPKIDENKCINCDLCIKVCPVLASLKKEEFKTIAYACKSRNEAIREKSSSGGVFWSLCELVTKSKGVVFGAAFNKDFNVEHMYAETLEECIKFRGSKYVQSKIGESYSLARKFLKEGRVVLFSGTQCQIKGLKLFLQKEYDNLIAIDIICHGVPSPKVFNLYKDTLVRKYKGNIKSIRFRDKVESWRNFSYVTEFENGQVHSKTLREDTYMKGFLKDLYLRPSCYSCKAKNYSNGSDISLADYWGVGAVHKNLDDNRGVSLVIVNSKKGLEVFEEISMKIEYAETDLDYATKCNPSIIKPSTYNKKRDKFFKEINSKKYNDIESTIEKYCKDSNFVRVKAKVLGGLSRVKSGVIRLTKSDNKIELILKVINNKK